jgi:hypothetical protein
MAIIQHPRDRSAHRRDPYELPIDGRSNGELGADRRPVVPVMLGYERLRLLYRHGHHAQALQLAARAHAGDDLDAIRRRRPSGPVA